MHIESYDSHEEMMDALREHNRHAQSGLSVEQRAITGGDYWVRFVDLDSNPPVVEFGYVHTPEEVMAEELASGNKIAQASNAVHENSRREMEQGLLYGTAWSIYCGPDGEVGTTHKSNVWPIEKRLFDLAQEQSFLINELGDLGRFLLNLAFTSHRAHFRATYGRNPG